MNCLLEGLAMAKDLAQMTHAERMAALISKDMGSPAYVELADQLIKLIGHELQDIHGMREMAARRQGIAALPLPPMPLVTGQQAPAEQPSPVPASDSHPPIKAIAELVELYRTHKDSRFHAVQYRTRTHYDYMLRRITKDHGNAVLAEMDSQSFISFYKLWKSGGKGDSTYMAHGLVTMLRGLFNFGAVTLKDAQCERLSMALHRMHFRTIKKPRKHITEEEVDAVISKAVELLVPSIALAQALQFEFGLVQRDVCGEWVPQDEPGDSDLVDGGMKWVRGLRWENIKKGVLRHHALQGNKPLVLDLTKSRRVIEALERVGRRDRGPLVVYEKTGRPYYAQQFTQMWREVATAAGLPEHVQNKHSRGRKAPVATGELDPSDGAANVVKELPGATTRH
jgi:hypothetical protein